jgi:hypothetical protein
MSRHFFETTYKGKPISILMGYDRPMNGFYMVIDYTHEADDGYIYSNLSNTDAYPKGLETYRKKLNELGIQVPDEIFKELESDQRRKIGNKTVRHSVVNGQYQRKGTL